MVGLVIAKQGEENEGEGGQPLTAKIKKKLLRYILYESHMSSSGINLLQEKALGLILFVFVIFYLLITMTVEIRFCSNIN